MQESLQGVFSSVISSGPLITHKRHFGPRQEALWMAHIAVVELVLESFTWPLCALGGCWAPVTLGCAAQDRFPF